MMMGDAAGVWPGGQPLDDDFIHAEAMFDLGEDKRAVAAHFPSVPLHHRQVGADRRSQVGLVLRRFQFSTATR